MRQPQSRARFALVGLALLVVALVVAACAGVTPTQAPASDTPAPAAQATQPAAGGQTPSATTAPGQALDLPVGVDADGNFYRGDPNAPVKLVEWSDFQ
jgi:protein-disulfide isomerase